MPVSLSHHTPKKPEPDAKTSAAMLALENTFSVFLALTSLLGSWLVSFGWLSLTQMMAAFFLLSLMHGLLLTTREK